MFLNLLCGLLFMAVYFYIMTEKVLYLFFTFRKEYIKHDFFILHIYNIYVVVFFLLLCVYPTEDSNRFVHPFHAPRGKIDFFSSKLNVQQMVKLMKAV